MSPQHVRANWHLFTFDGRAFSRSGSPISAEQGRCRWPLYPVGAPRRALGRALLHALGQYRAHLLEVDRGRAVEGFTPWVLASQHEREGFVEIATCCNDGPNGRQVEGRRLDRHQDEALRLPIEKATLPLSLTAWTARAVARVLFEQPPLEAARAITRSVICCAPFRLWVSADRGYPAPGR